MKKPKVVILCGGLGTRLRAVEPIEETEYRPKPLVEVGGRPILWHIMKIYAHYGFNEFILCLGHKGNMIKEYFLNYRLINSDVTVRLGRGSDVRIEHPRGDEDDWVVTLADTGEKAMTGARVKRIERYIDDDHFMLTYGDGVTDLDIRQLLEFHAAHARIGTVTGVYPSSRFGELVVRQRDGESLGYEVLKFSEKPHTQAGISALPIPASGQVKGAGTGFISGGFFSFRREFFDYLQDDDSCILEREPLEKLALDGELRMFKHTGFWQCLDSYRELILLNQMWTGPRPPWKVWDEGGPRNTAEPQPHSANVLWVKGGS